MNSIILCEGETDQVLISYYFIKNFGFEYYKKAKYFPSCIVEKSRDVVRDLLDNIDKFSDSYLSTRREQIKAPLAVFLGVTVPERTFDGMKKMMESIPWDNYQAIREMFAAFDVFKEDGM